MREIIRSLCLFLCAPLFAQTPERHFRFHYAFSVKNVNSGQTLRVWIPLAHSDKFQRVRVIAKSGDLPLKKTREALHGNEMLYGMTAKADKPEYHFARDYETICGEVQLGFYPPLSTLILRICTLVLASDWVGQRRRVSVA